MKKLVYQTDKILNNLFIAGRYEDITISGRIYRIDRKFLGFRLKPIYRYTINSPRLLTPLYDGEFNTCKLLQYHSQMLEQELKDKIQKLEEQDCKQC